MAELPSLPREAWLEIDVSALANNVAVYRDLAGPQAALGVVVKADAYGHGLRPTALAFQAAGADRLCVASLDEALALRAGGVTLPLLVLFSVPADGLDDARAAGVDVTVSALGDVDALARNARAGTGSAALTVHVEVETGLSRAGVLGREVPSVISRLREMAGVRLSGIWAHLASPEEEEFTGRQVAVFDAAVDALRAANLPVPPRHVAATGGVLTGRAPAYEGVRIGLGAYGILPLDLPIPAEIAAHAARLRPAMTLKCRALRIERFPPGTRVSYGGRWTAERESVIATLPVGYADAIPRAAPWGEALVRGRRVPMVGSVAMDAVMVDITYVPGVGPGDEFVLLGRDGNEQITAAELARARNTIPWEVATGMSYRLPRVYHAASVLMGVRTLNTDTFVIAGERP